MARFLRLVAATTLVLIIGASRPAPAGAQLTLLSKLDPLAQQATHLTGRSRIIVRGTSAEALQSVLPLVQFLGGRVLRQLPHLNSAAVDLPNTSILPLAASSLVARLTLDRVLAGSMERTGPTVGATAVRSRLGLDGSGVGIAVIDSGITPWHDDLGDGQQGQRVDRFVDFTGSQTTPYDDYGHGTHVAGIIAGNGADSGGARSGIAPAAHLVVLKVLDGDGHGRISDVIAALGYAVDNKTALNIRIVNLSVATGVYESYWSDPLTLAARDAVDAGIVVVAAAGNYGRSPQGQTQYEGVTAPGNAPWVLTVGASSHMGTIDRGDDTMAVFSSRGPTAVDYGAKPDLVAPGVGIESLSNPSSQLYTTHADGLLPGTVQTSYLPYLSLSGTSMAAPVVSGTVALMLQANASLTPNAVKAILQFTSQTYFGYDPLTQGAGFLNADGAVSLAAWFVAPATTPYPDATTWSGRVIWGNRLLSGAGTTPDAVPWTLGVVWGDPGAGNFASLPNVVWLNLCGGADCTSTPWSRSAVAASAGENETVVWGTNSGEGETVVWGTNSGESDTVVWGTSDGEGDTVVWGTSCTDPSCSTVVWGRQ